MPASAPATRDPWFDNAKFVLVALVVVGHSLVMLADNTVTDWLYDFLYAWHVPAFVLVTGYLSRSFAYSPSRLRGLVRTVLVPYVVFEGLLALFRTQVGGETLHHIWRDPHWPMWYLSALLVWRLLTPAFKRLPMPVAALTAVGLSLSAGWWAGSTLDLSRAFGLLPFFVIGLTVRREHLAVLHRRWAQWVGVAALGAILLAARFTGTWISSDWLYYRDEYTALGATGPGAMGTRLLVLGIGLLGALAVLSLIPARRTWYTHLGAASLVVYLFHGFFIKGAEYAGLGDWADSHPALSLLVVPSSALGLAVLLAQPPLARRLNRLVDPIGAMGRVQMRSTYPDRDQQHQRVPMPAGLH